MQPDSLDSCPALRSMVRLAQAALVWERLWPLILPPLAVGGILAGLALLDVLPLLPLWLHGLVLAAASGGMAFLGVRVVLRFRFPTRAEILARLERDSALSHNPLTSFSDPLASGADDGLTLALWQAHRRRLAELSAHLRLSWPDPGMAARDPYGWRAAVLLLLVIAVTVGGRDARPRLARALAPALSMPVLAAGEADLWLTPPAYTGLPPVALHGGQEGGTVSVPAGTAVLGLLSGGWGRGRLVVDGAEVPFEDVAGGGQRLEAPLPKGRTLVLKQGWRRLGAWTLTVTADALPSIAFAVPPEEGERGRLRLNLEASDDYGLARAWLNMRRAGMAEDEAAAEVDLPLPAGRPKSAELSVWKDLSAHPWAGLPVTLQPVAQDGLGQVGTGAAVTIALPEREFTHPVARALVDRRRVLAADRRQYPAAVELLGGLLDQPELLNGDIRLVLSLGLAHSALTDRQGFDLSEVLDLLWNAALRLEDGDLPAAERGVEEARRAVEQALASGASAEEVSALLDRFQATLRHLMRSMARQAAMTGAPVPGSGRVISDEDLEAVLQRMGDLAQADARDALADMLRQMQDLLANLHTAPQAIPPATLEALGRLRQITRQQQGLMEQSLRAGQPGADTRQWAQAQDKLRAALGEVDTGLGGLTGEALSQAESAMGDAALSLNAGEWEAAAVAQGQALAHLRQALRDAAGQLGQGGGGVIPRDPLGRAMTGSGTGDDGATRVPDQAETRHSRRILEELRRRLGEPARPEPERDYLKRLLRQF